MVVASFDFGGRITDDVCAVDVSATSASFAEFFTAIPYRSATAGGVGVGVGHLASGAAMDQERSQGRDACRPWRSESEYADS